MLSVLLVEPHPDTRDLYREWLTMAGLQVHSADTAADARALVPLADIVITETRLPGRPDAFTFIAELRSSPETSHLPIVVLSASGSFAETQARAAGCDLFLAKPCLPEQLQVELFLLTKRGRPSRLARARRTAGSARKLLRRLG